MEYASQAYMEQMSRNVRNKSYVWITLGLVNMYAQENAYISSSFTGSERYLYEGYTKDEGATSTESDGSMTFTFQDYYTLNLSGITLTLGGQTLPNSITVTNGQHTFTVDVIDNIVSVEEHFDECHYIKITPDSGALKVQKINFGIGVRFSNEEIMNTSRNNTVKHLNDELPMKEFSFTVHNYDRMWNKDNPYSYQRYLQEKQRCEYTYGREMDDGSIYKVAGGVVYLKKWSSDDYSAKFSCLGKLDYTEDEYYKGQFYPEGIDLYTLAELVLLDAGIVDYKLDSSLRRFIVHNPLPIDTHKACLQMIAHAGMCVLFEDRDGAVCLKSADYPELIKTAELFYETSFSLNTDLLNENTNSNYGSTEPNYTRADGLHYFYPENPNATTLSVGYVSEEYANSSGTFTNNPNFEIKFNSQTVLEEVVLNCPVAPKDYSLVVYLEDAVADIVNVTNNTDVTMTHTFDEVLCDKVVVTFTKTTPYQRIHVNYIELIGKVYYEITYKDLNATPVANGLDEVSKLEVALYNYTPFDYSGSSSSIEIEDEDHNVTEYDSLSTTEVEAGENLIYLSEASSDLSAAYTDEDYGVVTILESGAYYVKLMCSRAGEVTIYGVEYREVKKTYEIPFSEIGKPVKVSNPLIDSIDHVKLIRDWLLDYYGNDVEYTLSYRGDPILDADDCVYLENQFVLNNLIRIESESLNTAAGMSQNNTLIARRVSYQVPAILGKALVGYARVGDFLE